MGSAAHLFGKSHLNQPLREWHSRQCCEGTTSTMISLWTWDDWRLLAEGGSLGTSCAIQLDSHPLCAGHAWASVRFRRKCSNRKGRSICGIWARKVGNQKASPQRRQRECWKETFYSGQQCVSSQFIWNFRKKVSQGRLLPEAALCPFQ